MLFSAQIINKLLSYIEINNCKHYLLNEEGSPIIYNIHNFYFVEIDIDTKHPLGTVYKPKGIIDTNIRFVKQPNNSTFIFNIKEWNTKQNIYFKEKITFKKIIYFLCQK